MGTCAVRTQADAHCVAGTQRIGTEPSRRFQIKRATASVGRGDVSANADPLTGYEVLIHGAT
jgi:hypothetical protein